MSALRYLVVLTVSVASARVFGMSSVDEHHLQALIAQARSISDCQCVKKGDQMLARKIQAYKSDAIPYLLLLLRDQKESVRDFAGYVLRDQEGLTENDLAPLVAAMQNGNDWVPWAIARIGTANAMDALVSELQAHPTTGNQLSGAIAQAGSPALMALAKKLDGTVANSPDFANSLCYIFSEATSRPAVDMLLQAARDHNANLENRRQAVRILGCAKADAISIVPALHALSEENPTAFQHVVEETIIQTGSADAVPLLVARLEKSPDVYDIRSLAHLGENGEAAGPFLVTLLAQNNADIRVAAARALGFVHYVESADLLIAQLSDEDDWRMVYASAEALGLFHTEKSLDALRGVAARHWFPPVRIAAQRAIDAIKSNRKFVPLPGIFNDNFYAYEQFAYKQPAHEKLRAVPVLEKEKSALTQRELHQISYQRPVVGNGSGGEHASLKKSQPSSGIKLGENYIVGSDFGEFGGELMLISKDAPAICLLKQNTQGIHDTPFGLVAITGLAHMSSNHGEIYRITATADGYVATRWKTLPGAPERSGMLKNGKLFVKSDNGDVVIGADGKIEMASDANVK